MDWIYIFMMLILATNCENDYEYDNYDNGDGGNVINLNPEPRNSRGDFPSTDYEERTEEITPKVEQTRQKMLKSIEKYRSDVIGLMGSPANANEQVFHYMEKQQFNPVTNKYIWDWEQARINLEKTYEEQEVKLPAIEHVLQIIESSIGELFEGNEDLWQTMKMLRDHRSNFDCLSTSTAVSARLTNLTEGLLKNFEYWNCQESLMHDWRFVKELKDHKTCSTAGAYEDIIYISRILGFGYDRQNFTFDETLKKNYEIKKDLVDYLSSDSVYPYYKKFSCYGRSACSVDEDILAIICAYDLTIDAVSSLLMRIESYVPQTAFEVEKMLEIQTKLGDTFQDLVEIEGDPSEARTTIVVTSMLDSYLNVVDKSFGSKNWQQVPQSRAQKGFKDTLARTDEFVGSVADRMFRPSEKMQHREIEKDILSLKLAKFGSNDTEGVVAFNFSHAEINTALGRNYSEDIIVYAFHYSSWDFNPGNNHSDGFQSQRTFVGDGGIISLSAKVGKEGKSVPVTYKISFSEQVEVNNSKGVTSRCLSCEYFNTTTDMWDTNGCHVTGVEGGSVVCDCDHTTNFGAFMSPVEITLDLTETQVEILNILTYAGSSLSATALLLALFCFNIVHSAVHNDRLRAHINLCIALFVVHVTQLFVDLASRNQPSCLIIAIITHYFLLSSFAWMFVEGIFLYLYVVQVFVNTGVDHRKWMYTTGWVLPAVIVIASVAFFLPKNEYLAAPVSSDALCGPTEMLYPPLQQSTSDHNACFLNVQSGAIWTFVGPAAAIILFNFIILVRVVYVLVQLSKRNTLLVPYSQKSSSESQNNYNLSTSKYQSQSSTAPAYRRHTATPDHAASEASVYLKSMRSAAKGTLVLLPILGIPWLFGMFVNTSFIMILIYLGFNSTQGVVIFIIYCLRNEEIRRPLLRYLKNQKSRRRTSSMVSLKTARSKMNAKRSRAATVTSNITASTSVAQ